MSKNKKENIKVEGESYVDYMVKKLESSIGCREYICEDEFIPEKTGYHLSQISKGVLGSISKIEEELNELKDAEKQGSKVMMMVELSDMYGAIEEYCLLQGLTMEDLKIFSDITKRAFKNGRRK